MHYRFPIGRAADICKSVGLGGKVESNALTGRSPLMSLRADEAPPGMSLGNFQLLTSVEWANSLLLVHFIHSYTKVVT